MRIWVAEVDEVTCDYCAGMNGAVIEDFDEWDIPPGDVHNNCRCFEMVIEEPGMAIYETPGETPLEADLEPTPQADAESAFNWALPAAALLAFWPSKEGEEKRRYQYEEDDYERLLEWTTEWR